MRLAIVLITLSSTVAACGPVKPELPNETKFNAPLFNPAESKELVQILNSHRTGWDKLFYTPPADSNVQIKLSSPTGGNATIFYYTDPAEGRCTMIMWQDGSTGVQSFSSTICEELDAILIGSSKAKANKSHKLLFQGGQRP